MGQQIYRTTLRVAADEYPALYAWLTSLTGLPYGEKGRAIIAVLERGLAYGQEPAPESVSVGATLDLTAFLPEIRAVVEAAIHAALAQHTVVAQDVQPNAALDPDLDAFLSDLDADLLLD